MGSRPYFENDIFLNYNHVDDVSDSGGKGWVRAINDRLAIRLPQLSGIKPRIVGGLKLQGNDAFVDNLVVTLSNSLILIAVVTPNYVRSEWCRHELREFYQRASASGGLVVHGRARIFKVLKTYVPYNDQPPELRDLPSYDFFEIDPKTGEVNEFSSATGPDYDIRYWDRFDQLSRDIEFFLAGLQNPTDRLDNPQVSVKQSSNYDVIEKVEPSRFLKVFLCHASDDKPSVRNLYRKLRADSVDAWLDEEKLLPGQNWQREIPRAVRQSDAVIVCLSERAVDKKGFVQKEIKYALDVADEQPEDVIFLIPLRFQECGVPSRLEHFHWVDYFHEKGHERLMRALRARATSLSVVAGEAEDPRSG